MTFSTGFIGSIAPGSSPAGPASATAPLPSSGNHQENTASPAGHGSESETWLDRTIDVSGLEPDVALARLLEQAIRLEASDLFLSTTARGVVVQVRQHGVIHPISVMAPDAGRRVLNHVRAAASMDFNERRRPLDGRWMFISASGRTMDMRVATIPTLHGEDISIRLLSRDSGYFFKLDQLGMTPRQLHVYSESIQDPGGMVLIAGPTGSGKTATLYSSLARINNGTRKISTVEDPVEFAMDGLHQSQVNPMIDLSFNDLLRSVLRQNPDVIMIGEIRDERTAQLAVHAAGSGMLVFATLHSQGTVGAIQTMRTLGCHPHFLASTLRMVLSQRLMRTLCTQCRTAIPIEDAPQMFEEVRPWMSDGEGRTLYSRQGCPACGMSGYAGRTGVFEIMPVSNAIRSMIAAGKPINEIRDKAVAEGMLTFRQAALLKVARGESTTDEIFRVIPALELMIDD